MPRFKRIGQYTLQLLLANKQQPIAGSRVGAAASAAPFVSIRGIRSCMTRSTAPSRRALDVTPLESPTQTREVPFFGTYALDVSRRVRAAASRKRSSGPVAISCLAVPSSLCSSGQRRMISPLMRAATSLRSSGQTPRAEDLLSRTLNGPSRPKSGPENRREKAPRRRQALRSIKAVRTSDIVSTTPITRAKGAVDTKRGSIVGAI